MISKKPNNRKLTDGVNQMPQYKVKVKLQTSPTGLGAQTVYIYVSSKSESLVRSAIKAKYPKALGILDIEWQ